MIDAIPGTGDEMPDVLTRQLHEDALTAEKTAHLTLLRGVEKHLKAMGSILSAKIDLLDVSGSLVTALDALRARMFPKPAATRVEVYASLDSERRYQDSRWNRKTTSTGGAHESLLEWIAYQEHYLGLAKVILSTKPEPDATEAALHVQRKVTALGVAAMEAIGAPQRPVHEFPATHQAREQNQRDLAAAAHVYEQAG
jgi:hypothetical protein